MIMATIPEIDILQSCSGHASHWVKDIEFESVIAVWASVFALKITHTQLVGYLCYRRLRVTKDQHVLFFNLNLLRLKSKNNISFFVKV